MSYRFIIGRGGGEKSKFALNELINDSLLNKTRKYLLIVPEQYTMQMQKEVVRLHPKHAVTNIDVLSFNRLALKVFSELNIKLPGILDDISKAVIIRKVALDNRRNLPLWKDKFSKYAFLDKFKSLLSEFYQYNISPETIEKVISDDKVQRPAVLSGKLAEIKTLYRAFDDFIKGKHITSEEVPDVLAKNLHKSELIKDAYIVFDGFTGFTPVQYKLIEVLMSKASHSDFTLCADTAHIDSEKLDEDSLFYMSMLMSKTINTLADKNGIKQEKSVYMDELSTKSEDLQHLERYFLREEEKIRKEDVKDIRIINAKSLEDEASFVINEVNTLIKKKGLRYRDIAIISGDLNRYADKLSTKLFSSNIPFHMDTNIKISTNIFVEFIDNLLEMLVDNYSYNTVMRYIRSPFAFKEETDEYELYSLDNYMYMTGVKSYRKFSNEFKYIPKRYKGVSKEKLNELREKILGDTKDLYLLLSKKAKDEEEPGNEINAVNIIQELKSIFEKLDIESKLNKISKDFAAKKDEQRAREYEEVYESVLNLFDTLEELLASEKLKKKEFLELFKAGLAQVEIGLIPSVIDSVFIGDIVRSRVPEVKAVFIMGVNDGVLPGLNNKYSLINDREKEFLKENYNLKLSQTLKQEVHEQKYYVYLALTKAGESLYLSYSNTDTSMKAIKPAYIIQSITKLFTNLEIEKFDELKNINSQSELLKKLADMLRIYEGRLCDEEKFKEVVPEEAFLRLSEMAEFTYIGRELGTKAAAKIFGEILKASVSRLEKFAACPYRHFVDYGLKISERQAYSIAGADIGTLVHSCLERVFKDYIEFGKAVKADPVNKYMKDLDDRVDKIVNAIIEEEGDDKYEDSAKSRYIKQRVTRLLKANLDVLFFQLKQGSFEPESLEFNFDIRDRKIYDLELPDGKKMYVNGKIDRIDIYDSGADSEGIEGSLDTNTDYIGIKIIDYKTGNTKWDPKLVDRGLQLQLAFYLDVCLKIYQEKYSKAAVPAAMFYSNLAENFIKKEDFEKEYKRAKEEKGEELNEEESNELIRLLLMREYKPDGLVNNSKRIIKALDNNMFDNKSLSEKSSDILPLSTEPVIKDERGEKIISEWNVKSSRSSKMLADKEEMLEVLNFVNAKVKELGSKILDGNIEVKPVEEEKFACAYCNYKSICGFDRKIKGYEYNKAFSKADREEE